MWHAERIKVTIVCSEACNEVFRFDATKALDDLRPTAHFELRCLEPGSPPERHDMMVLDAHACGSPPRACTPAHVLRYQQFAADRGVRMFAVHDHLFATLSVVDLAASGNSSGGGGGLLGSGHSMLTFHSRNLASSARTVGGHLCVSCAYGASDGGRPPLGFQPAKVVEPKSI